MAGQELAMHAWPIMLHLRTQLRKGTAADNKRHDRYEKEFDSVQDVFELQVRLFRSRS